MKNSLLPFKYLQPVSLSDQHQQPHSLEFDDIYFNSSDGLAESDYVFIQGNDLINRWTQSPDINQFVIAETGFGTGLNLLATLQAWEACKHKPPRLHFISIEKFPLQQAAMESAHAAFPELQPYSQPLLKIWQRFADQFRHGLHDFELIDGVRLTLGFGDATTIYKQLKGCVHAWFLDGFAPKKNPDMWNDELFQQINRLSQPQTSIATFTAASQIRKRLQQFGFEVSKKSGFGKKREMITARYAQPIAVSPNKKPWAPLPTAQTTNKQVTIIGAGIAGLSLAYQFKQAGYQTTVIEQHAQAMQEGSGNALAMMMPVITAQNSPETLLYQRAFEYAQRFYQPDELYAIGVNQHLNSPADIKWAETVKNQTLPASLIQIQAQDKTAHYPQAGYVDTQKIANRLKQYVDRWLTMEVEQISQQDECWRLNFKHQNTVETTHLLILANGIRAQQLTTNLNITLGLTAKHGMTSEIRNDDTKLAAIQLSAGYIIPDQKQNRWVCGATFDHLPESKWYQDAQLNDDHWQRNKHLWQQHDIFETLNQAQIISGHAAIRATTADHLPICGPCMDQEQFKLDYQDLHHGRHWQVYPTAKKLPNLYILNGLGSRGFTSAPLLAHYLCAMIDGQPLPLERDLCKIIHPNRFLYRSLKKPPN